MRRGVAIVAAAALVAIGAFGATAWVSGGGDEAAPVTTTAPAPLARLRIIFPEGFSVREMADRVAAVREIAIGKRGVTPRLTRGGYLRAVDAGVGAAPFRKDVKRDSLEGFLFPASYEFTRLTTARELVADQLRAFRQRFRSVDLSYARSKNLTPYDVLIIASMIEKETAVPRERRLVAAVIYNRLRNRMPLGIDATIRYGLDYPRDQVADQGGAQVDVPVQHADPHRPPADADREPRARVDSRRGEPDARGRLPLLRPQAEVPRALLHCQRERLPAQGLRVRLRLRLRSHGLPRVSGGVPSPGITASFRLCDNRFGTTAAPRRATLRANVLACPLEHLDEQLSQMLRGLPLRVEPLGRKELASSALVLATRLEPGEEPSVDVVDAHPARCRPERGRT